MLVTGASSGIGRELSKRYAKRGDSLFLISRRENLLKSLKNELEEKGAEVFIYPCDLSDYKKLEVVKKDILEKSGGIDMIIANAGISAGHNCEYAKYEDIEYMMRVNFLSIPFLLEPFLEDMKSKRAGKIVFISSLASLVTMPTSTAYSTSKRALNSYAEGIRNHLYRYNIKVINILPGFIDTPMTRKNSFKMPFFMDLQSGVEKIVYAIEKEKKEYAFPLMFYLAIKLLSFMPPSLRDKIIRYVNNKKVGGEG
nr:SDR family NAD(P)-dependent oxidoreductase [Nitrosophilus alvini]